MDVLSCAGSTALHGHTVMHRSCSPGATGHRHISAFKPSARHKRCHDGAVFLLAVGHVVLESRGPKDDGRDRQLLDFMRRKRQLPASIRIDHTRGPEEPMLWIPDAVCGMVVAMRTGTPTYYEQIRTRSTLIEI